MVGCGAFYECKNNLKVSTMAIVTKPEQHFIAAQTIDWNSGLIGGLPRMALIAAGSYSDPESGVSATVVQADPLQNIQENRCHPATFRCNVALGMVLLLVDNGPWAPIHIQFSGNGVSSLGSYAVAKWNPNVLPVAYTASLYVRLLGSGPNDWVSAGASQGLTGDIWSPNNPSFAPFVGCAAASGSRIVAARFDVGHAQDGSFSPVGITNLYFYV
jgi:hypothetical protein